jgi:hypothetical protein
MTAITAEDRREIHGLAADLEGAPDWRKPEWLCEAEDTLYSDENLHALVCDEAAPSLRGDLLALSRLLADENCTATGVETMARQLLDHLASEAREYQWRAHDRPEFKPYTFLDGTRPE